MTDQEDRIFELLESLLAAVDAVRGEVNALSQSVKQTKSDSDLKLNTARSNLIAELKKAELKNYRQLESLHWLSRQLATKHRLPPMRAWVTSPDILLDLHEHIIETRPNMVVEFGSGLSTLVIADALRQNGRGKLVSLEHSAYYGNRTRQTLRREYLEIWVDLRIGDLEIWSHKHLNQKEGEELRWYPQRLVEGLEGVDLVFVDGPPGATCQYARYPALPAIHGRLSSAAEVWMDDTIRQEERDICAAWAEEYGLDVEYLDYEKGLGRMTRRSV